MSNRISTPFPIFNDKDGSPLDAGFIYFGELNKSPLTSPISIFYDSALTMPAENPVRTQNGFVAKNGSLRQVFCAEPEISIQVQNKQKEIVWSSGSINLNPGVTTDAVIDSATGDSQAEINAETLRKASNLNDLSNKEQARTNLSVYSKTEIDNKTVQATETTQGMAKLATNTIAETLEDDTTIITPKKLKRVFDNKGLLAKQKWQDFTTSRVAGSTYTNNTKSTIKVSVTGVSSGGYFNGYVDGLLVHQSQYPSVSVRSTVSLDVPSGSNYVVSGFSADHWVELREEVANV